MNNAKSYWDLDDAGRDAYVADALKKDDACTDKRIGHDRAQWALGEFIASQDGPEYVRDAMDDKLVREIGQLIQCGDLAAIGPLFARFMSADKGMQAAMEYDAEEKQRQIDLELREFASSQIRQSWRDPETGIPMFGEI